MKWKWKYKFLFAAIMRVLTISMFWFCCGWRVTNECEKFIFIWKVKLLLHLDLDWYNRTIFIQIIHRLIVCRNKLIVELKYKFCCRSSSRNKFIRGIRIIFYIYQWDLGPLTIFLLGGKRCNTESSWKVQRSRRRFDARSCTTKSMTSRFSIVDYRSSTIKYIATR